jgi:hypothetical protein
LITGNDFLERDACFPCDKNNDSKYYFCNPPLITKLAVAFSGKQHFFKSHLLLLWILMFKGFRADPLEIRMAAI